MFRLIINNTRLILSKKSFILMGVIAPALIILFFGFAFGKEYTYKVAVLDDDKSFTSQQIINSLSKMENIDLIYIEGDYESKLLTQDIEVAIIIDKNTEQDLLNLKPTNIKIYSIGDNEIKTTIKSIIQLKTNDLSLIARTSNNDIEKFKEIYEKSINETKDIEVNKLNSSKPLINYSLGIVIMMIFITGASVTNFLIEDDENNTKNRILTSGIKPYRYYLSLLIVFCILSSLSCLIYYVLAKALGLEFLMKNTEYFLIVLLCLNLVSVALNLLISTISKNRYVANTINIILVIPSCMLSGAFWDFSVMPKYMQNIGNYLPQRWVYIALEDLQKYNSLSNIYQYIFLMLMLSIGLFSLGISILEVKKIK